MPDRTKSLAGLALLASLAFAGAAAAQSVPAGSGTLVGRDRLRVPGCGREVGPVSLDFALAANGGWTADVGATTYSGTSTQLTRRLARLTLDAASLTALETALEADASALCEETVAITTFTNHAVLKVNKRQDRARIRLRARGEGTIQSGDEGRGLYRLRARGGWTPAP